MRKATEFEMEQTIFLGGKISAVHAEFQKFAMYDPDTAFCIWFLEEHDKLSQKNPNDRLIEILKALGKLELIRTSTELTKLAMIVGDTSKGIDMKGEVERLRQRTSGTVPNPQ